MLAGRAALQPGSNSRWPAGTTYEYCPPQAQAAPAEQLGGLSAAEAT